MWNGWKKKIDKTRQSYLDDGFAGFYQNGIFQITFFQPPKLTKSKTKSIYIQIFHFYKIFASKIVSKKTEWEREKSFGIEYVR